LADAKRHRHTPALNALGRKALNDMEILAVPDALRC
jgi:hypothetical protein